MTTIVEEPLPYSALDKNYQGLLVRQTDGRPKAAVILLPDWRGQSALARDHARFLVEHGCVVVIGDLYGDGFTPDRPDQVASLVQRLLENRDAGVAALSACVASVHQSMADVPVFVLGYSAGAVVALDHGRQHTDVAGIILCSGLLKTAWPGQSTRIAAPVLMLQGTQDAVSPMAVVDQVIAEMDAAGNDVRFVLFSQTHHAFDNPEAGTDRTARLVYSPRAAAQARETMIDFILALSAPSP